MSSESASHISALVIEINQYAYSGNWVTLDQLIYGMLASRSIDTAVRTYDRLNEQFLVFTTLCLPVSMFCL